MGDFMEPCGKNHESHSHDVLYGLCLNHLGSWPATMPNVPYCTSRTHKGKLVIELTFQCCYPLWVRHECTCARVCCVVLCVTMTKGLSLRGTFTSFVFFIVHKLFMLTIKVQLLYRAAERDVAEVSFGSTGSLFTG